MPTAPAAAMNTFAFKASSTPPFTINAAIGLTGASSIQRRERLVTFLVNATSRMSSSSSDLGLPRIFASAFTLGSNGSDSSSSVKTLRALCHSPLSVRQSAAATRGKTINGFSLTNRKEMSRASLCKFWARRSATCDNLAVIEMLSLCIIPSTG